MALADTERVHLARICCEGAGVVHAAAIRAHLAEYWVFPVFFALAAIAQIGWAWFLPRIVSRPVLVAGAAGNLVIVMVWLVSRTTGVPIGPEVGPESVGLADVVATAFEVASAALALSLLARETGSLRQGAVGEATIVATTLIAGCTVGAAYLALLHA